MFFSFFLFCSFLLLPCRNTTVQGKVEKRHDDKDVENLVERLGKFEGVLLPAVPTTAPVEESTAGPCSGCGKKIVDRTYSTLGRDNYHTACFTCSRCQTAISGSGEKVGNALVCERCVDLPKCRRCGGAIAVSQRFVSPDDATKYHSDGCVTCGDCKARLNLDNVFFLNGDMFCEKCAPNVK